jgi:hypothetical protein
MNVSKGRVAAAVLVLWVVAVAAGYVVSTEAVALLIAMLYFPVVSTLLTIADKAV